MREMDGKKGLLGNSLLSIQAIHSNFFPLFKKPFPTSGLIILENIQANFNIYLLYKLLDFIK